MAILPMIAHFAGEPAAAATPIPAETLQSVLTAVTDTFSVSTIVSYIAYILGATVGFVLIWWGIRKAFKAIKNAATKGKAGV